MTPLHRLLLVALVLLCLLPSLSPSLADARVRKMPKYSTMRVKTLKKLLRDGKIACAGCTEKGDLVKRLQEVWLAAPAESSASAAASAAAASKGGAGAAAGAGGGGGGGGGGGAAEGRGSADSGAADAASSAAGASPHLAPDLMEAEYDVESLLTHMRRRRAEEFQLYEAMRGSGVRLEEPSIDHALLNDAVKRKKAAAGGT